MSAKAPVSRPPRRDLVRVGVVVFALWSASSWLYFWLEPVLGAQIGYNDAPLTFTVIYGLWSLVAFLIFRRDYGLLGDIAASWGRIALVLGGLIVATTYVLAVVPNLPEVTWDHPNAPVQFFYATGWYALPKSVEILFQQLLVAALVIAAWRQGYGLGRISLVVAILFGGFHFTLGLSYPNPLYVVRYSVVATLFGAMVPFLLVRLRNGFLISYALHWSYYAVDYLAIHMAFSAAS